MYKLRHKKCQFCQYLRFPKKYIYDFHGDRPGEILTIFVFGLQNFSSFEDSYLLLIAFVIWQENEGTNKEYTLKTKFCYKKGMRI
jgi:hypothetical protein